MSPELDKKLVEKYPKIFADRFADKRTTAMCWGFECGDGWFWLIDNLCDSIQSQIDLNPHLDIPQVVTSQVKEKFGGLRFYYNGGDNKIDGKVSFAEYLSYSICESCGSTKNVTQKETNGWISTICEDCAEKERKQIVAEKLKSGTKIKFPENNEYEFSQDMSGYQNIPGDVIFEIDEDATFGSPEGRHWLKAPGYGIIGDYGNGAILVKDEILLQHIYTEKK